MKKFTAYIQIIFSIAYTNYFERTLHHWPFPNPPSPPHTHTVSHSLFSPPPYCIRYVGVGGGGPIAPATQTHSLTHSLTSPPPSLSHSCRRRNVHLQRGMREWGGREGERE